MSRINCDKYCLFSKGRLSHQPYDTIFKKKVYDTKSIQVRSIMRTFNYVQTPSIISTMSNQRCKNYKGRDERTWAYSH